jgi:hypothetical protein
MPQEPDPSPPAPIVLAGLLRLIASGLEWIEAEQWRPSGTIGVATGSGWWLVLRSDDRGLPVELITAQAPSRLVPPWLYGGQRDDWTLGPDARVVTPVDLLTVEQRAQLQRRLERAPRPVIYRPLPFWDLSEPDEELFLD